MAAVLAMGLSACGKWLDVKPYDKISEEELLSSEAGFEKFLNGIYIELNSELLYGGAMTVEMLEIMGGAYEIGDDNSVWGNYSELAASLHADLCQIYTDVDGVYTADPRHVKGAHKLDEITYDEMLELASLGAQVLHNRSVEMAKRYSVKMEVLSSLTGNPGTKVKEVVKKVEKTHVSGVAKDTNVSRLALVGLADQPGTAFKIFSMLAKYNINVDIILQSIGRDASKDISFTVSRGDGQKAKEILMENQQELGFKELELNEQVAKVSIVGAGMVDNAGVACKMFEALFSAGINISMISTSEIKVSVLMEERDADHAVQVIHDRFFDEFSQN